MNADRIIQAGEQTHVIRFGQYAIFLLEQASGKSVAQFSEMPPYSAAYLMLYAGLECARQKHKTRPQPWTLDEVGELIVAAGGMATVQSVILDAWVAAFPASKLAVEAATTNNKNGADSKNETTQQAMTVAPAGIASSATPSNAV